MSPSIAVAGRFRIGTAAAGGTRLVTDTGRGESFWLYQPLTLRQQLGGHETGRWYWRPLGCESASPSSIGYPSFEAALQGLKDSQAFKDLTSDEASRTPRPH